MAEKPKRRCIDCEAWEQLFETAKQNYGECRMNAPLAVVKHHIDREKGDCHAANERCQFPSVRETFWCMQFVRRED